MVSAERTAGKLSSKLLISKRVARKLPEIQGGRNYGKIENHSGKESHWSDQEPVQQPRCPRFAQSKPDCSARGFGHHPRYD